MSFTLLRNIPSLGLKLFMRQRFPRVARNVVYIPKRIIPAFQINEKDNGLTPKLLRSQFLMKGISLAQKRSSHAGCHNMDWVVEKIETISLAILLPVALTYSSITLDVIVSLLIAHHHYLGVDQVLTDYARPVVIGTTLAKICSLLNLLTTFLALLGFVFYSRHQMHFADGAKRIWRMAPKKKTDTE